MDSTLQNRLQLSPIDSLFIGSGSYPIEFTFFYDKTFATESMRARLTKAWHTVAEYCPPLRSRLEMEGDRYVFAWDEHSSKPDPINFASVNFSVHPDRHPNPYDLIDPVTTIPGAPLARLKITEGTDGLVIGFSLSHAIADGFTYFMVLGAITRAANPKTSSEPFVAMDHGRHLIFDLVRRSSDSENILGLSKWETRKDVDRNSIRYLKKHYDTERLKAFGELLSNSPKRLSLNDAICADLWREFTMEFDREEQESLSLVTPVDCRRVYPDFPKNYAGNAVALARLDLPRRDVIETPMSELARKIRQMVDQVNPEYIEDSCAGLSKKLNCDPWSGLGEYHLVHPKSGLLITNLSRLPFASLDFGAGPPSYCRPLTPCRRSIVLLSDGNNGVIAHIHY